MKRIFEKCSHKKQLFLALSALVLCLSISIGVTMAYFTDWSSASGTGAVADLNPGREHWRNRSLCQSKSILS